MVPTRPQELGTKREKVPCARDCQLLKYNPFSPLVLLTSTISRACRYLHHVLLLLSLLRWPLPTSVRSTGPLSWGPVVSSSVFPPFRPQAAIIRGESLLRPCLSVCLARLSGPTTRSGGNKIWRPPLDSPLLCPCSCQPIIRQSTMTCCTKLKPFTFNLPLFVGCKADAGNTLHSSPPPSHSSSSTPPCPSHRGWHVRGHSPRIKGPIRPVK